MFMEYKITKKKSLPPGTVIYTGESREESIIIESINYTADNLTRATFTSDNLSDNDIEQCLRAKWLRIKGVHRVDIIKKICEALNIYPVSIEDVVNVKLTPKIEEFENYIFILLRDPQKITAFKKLSSRQISIFLLGEQIITFEESGESIIDIIMERIEKNSGRVRKENSAYLGYAILDLVVDECLSLVEAMDFELLSIEENILSGRYNQDHRKLFKIKQKILSFINIARPLKKITNILSKNPLYEDKYQMYIRDVDEHAEQTIVWLSQLSDSVKNLINLQITLMSQKQGEVMRTLTVVGSIFIPLTFLAGLYGMNFKHMPELSLPFMYPVVLCLMFSIAVGMFYYFKKKKIL